MPFRLLTCAYLFFLWSLAWRFRPPMWWRRTSPLLCHQQHLADEKKRQINKIQINRQDPQPHDPPPPPPPPPPAAFTLVNFRDYYHYFSKIIISLFCDISTKPKCSHRKPDCPAIAPLAGWRVYHEFTIPSTPLPRPPLFAPGYPLMAFRRLLLCVCLTLKIRSSTSFFLERSSFPFNWLWLMHDESHALKSNHLKKRE